MQIIKTVDEMKTFVKARKAEGKTIGLVPTMGYLHDGHASLIRKSASQNDVTVVSVFVNPTQFAPNEDYDKYPRDIDNDSRVASDAGADVIFNPEPSEMYPGLYKTYVQVDDITAKLCGISRPTHFKGVTTVVCKLFNIAMADRAYFGQKDAQQLAVIKRMAADLNMNIEIIGCPIVREADGLAMSSRNIYLSAEERKQALCLSRSVKAAKEAIDGGEVSSSNIKKIIKDIIAQSPLAVIDHVEIVDFDTMDSIDTVKQGTLISLAVRFGSTMLIDNLII